MQFELTRQFIDNLKQAIVLVDNKLVKDMINSLHHTDIAQIFEELDEDEVKFVFLQLEGELQADVLMEFEEEDRKTFLSYLTSAEIAEDIIENLDSDDAADLIGDLSEQKQEEILSHIKDIEQAGDIVDLLGYDEDTAGGLMATELVSVNENLTVNQCYDEIRKQANDVEEVFYVYVIDNDEMLTGILPLKMLILAEPNQKVKNICGTDIIKVKTDTKSDEVAKIMEKYDLVVLPVVDSIGRLKGRITIDDVVDVIKEEAEHDYQMISGISSDIEANDSVFQLTKARIPWLVIGLMGGILGARVIGVFDDDLGKFPMLAFFIPLIAAMGGNVGIQSSSIIVQGLANNSLGLGSTTQKLLKELLVAILNGLICSSLVFIYNLITSPSLALTITVSSALMSIIIFASLFGTFIPLALNKLKIDPALATGPFITTINDVIGLFIYFGISKLFFTII